MEQMFELSNCEIMRLDVDDEHYYYGGLPGGIKSYFLSVTRTLDIGAPFPEGLRQYLRITDYDEQVQRLDFTGARGSKLHAALDDLMKGQQLSLSDDYRSTYEKDALVTFIRTMRFLNPSKFKTELIVADSELRIAGTTDFVGWVEGWKLLMLLEPLKYLELDSDGDLQPKEKWLGLPDTKKTHIVVDWKFTGRNAYSHKIQVAAYKTMYNKSYKGRVSRAFTWRYSPRHKFGFDFQESLKDYRDFKRIYDTTIDYLGEFPEPPTIKRYPESIKLFDKKG